MLVVPQSFSGLSSPPGPCWSCSRSSLFSHGPVPPFQSCPSHHKIPTRCASSGLPPASAPPAAPPGALMLTCGPAGVGSPPSWYLHSCSPSQTERLCCSPGNSSLNPSLPLLLSACGPALCLWLRTSPAGQTRKPRHSHAGPHLRPPRRSVGEPRPPLLPRRPPPCAQRRSSSLPRAPACRPLFTPLWGFSLLPVECPFVE